MDHKSRVKLVYPAQQYLKTETPRPDGSLGLLYIAAMLRDHAYEVEVLDACVGEDQDDIQDSFHNRTAIDEEHIRVGLAYEELVKRFKGFDVVGVTSIFTPQTYSCFEVAKAAKEANPDCVTIAGGGNARALSQLFLDNGFDIIALGEAEETMIELMKKIDAGQCYRSVKGIAYLDEHGTLISNGERTALKDLDQLPMPAWDLLPLKKYWEIGEPHGGSFDNQSEVRYLSMQTSRGCPFACKYCHISLEGDAAKLRFKSHERVMKEIDTIKKLGAEYLFFEDDSLLAKLPRIKKIFSDLRDKHLKIIDVNGVNLAHFFKKSDDKSKLIVDEELLDLMREVGWVEVAFPFESGSQRVIDEYATGKWSRRKHDVGSLVECASQKGIKISGFFTIGYPDETEDELSETYLLAQEMMGRGMHNAGFFNITPYPGSALYDYAVANGHLPEVVDLMKMKFAVPTMKNTLIPPDVLAYTRKLVYQMVNSKSFLKNKSTRTLEADEEKHWTAKAL